METILSPRRVLFKKKQLQEEQRIKRIFNKINKFTFVHLVYFGPIQGLKGKGPGLHRRASRKPRPPWLSDGQGLEGGTQGRCRFKDRKHEATESPDSVAHPAGSIRDEMVQGLPWKSSA